VPDGEWQIANAGWQMAKRILQQAQHLMFGIPFSTIPLPSIVKSARYRLSDRFLVVLPIFPF
jgi:hypothetical protein